MIKLIADKLYQPILYFFLLPLISLLPGSIFAFQYGQINYISLAILYGFVLANQLIENILLRIPTNDFQLSKKLLLMLEIINLLFILFFGLRHSWISAAALLLYTITIQLQFLFSYYDLEKTAVLITSILKVVLINSLSFYIHTNFVYYRLFPYYLSILLPYLIYELSRSTRKVNRKATYIIMTSSYLLTAALLWKDLGYISLLLFISSPFIVTFKETFNRKYLAIFLIFFSTIYITLLILVSII